MHGVHIMCSAPGALRFWKPCPVSPAAWHAGQIRPDDMMQTPCLQHVIRSDLLPHAMQQDWLCRVSLTLNPETWLMWVLPTRWTLRVSHGGVHPINPSDDPTALGC